MRTLFLSGLWVWWLTTSAWAATVPTGFTDTVYSSPDLGPATGMAWAPDGSGRLFITLKGGTVRVVRLEEGAFVAQPGKPSAPASELFATETPIFTNSECGLIGMAFDPNYVVNRYVYFFVTVTSSEQRIVRYTDTGTIGTARTEVVVGLPTRGVNHDGGGLGFGPDGKLYWSIGDNGNGTGVDADLTSLAAKVGRANLDGTPVNDNPYFDGVGPNNEYIWARGLRNPFTFTFQPSTGLLWVDTVGDGYEQIFVVRRGDHAGYNDYENNQPAGYITPVVKYRTNGVDTRTFTATGASRASGVATFTTTAKHLFRKGEKLVIDGVTDPSFNGTFYVSRLVSDTAFEVLQPGANATSGGGSATTESLGGSITGGTFYDATLFPADYRGNFLFGDYNSGQLTRVQLAGDNSVSQVDGWGTGFSSSVDLSVGPDGALYGMSYVGGTLHRIAPKLMGQKLVVSGLNLRVVEGGMASFTVQLAQAPTADVSVSVARTAGDSDLSVVGATSFTFTAANWNVPQEVRLAAAVDADTNADAASFTVSAAGLSPEVVTATSIDNNGPRLVLSTTALDVPEGGSATFTVALSQAPAAGTTIRVNVARTAGDVDLAVANSTPLAFTPSNWSVPQTVTVTAAQDADPDDGVATFTVAAPGVDARALVATERDDEPLAPVITSTPPARAVVGTPLVYDVDARARPAPQYSLLSSVPGMTLDATTGVLSWTPTTAGTVDVSVKVANGVAPDARQDFTLTVAMDAAPRAVLTRPTEGERVSGTMGEFFGDCVDDVGCPSGRFYVDGRLEYTDRNAGNHFHFGGEHNRWDTTGLSPGGHRVRFEVEDTSGQTGAAEVTVCMGDGDCSLATDAGTDPGPPPPDDSGCDCGATAVGPLAWLALSSLLARRRRTDDPGPR
ncbi:PQQ-dependent sugar dehydrogenase [Myxococcaceae bacterium JPH2]|nr:PQQ-dependent sugar dehydrogenase [Myxococcaceae bacterium JPH2]